MPHSVMISQPWQAYAQANVIGKHATEIAGGKTYAELPQDDPNRDTVMTASFLQASLFTSVVAFGAEQIDGCAMTSMEALQPASKGVDTVAVVVNAADRSLFMLCIWR